MSEYNLDLQYNDITLRWNEVNSRIWIVHLPIVISRNFIAVTLSTAISIIVISISSKINHVALRTVFFNKCKMIDVELLYVRQTHFEVHFKDCVLDFQILYLKMKGTTFTNTSLSCRWLYEHLTEVLFNNRDLYRSEFEKQLPTKPTFRTSYNYSIDPTKTKFKSTIFYWWPKKGC
jgi:hypothetical protein